MATSSGKKPQATTATAGYAMLDELSRSVLGCCITHNHRDLAKRVLRHVLRCFVLLDVHLDGDVFIGNVLLHEGKCDDR
jgi:hypothetical protein